VSKALTFLGIDDRSFCEIDRQHDRAQDSINKAFNADPNSIFYKIGEFVGPFGLIPGGPMAAGLANKLLTRGGSKLLTTGGRAAIRAGGRVGTRATGPAASAMGARAAAGTARATAETAVSGGRTLFHYTDESGLKGILDSGVLRPSLKSVNRRDVRYGNGQYLSDIKPGTKT
jgi:hypothetical protein